MNIHLKYQFGSTYPGHNKDEDITLHYQRAGQIEERADFQSLSKAIGAATSADLEVTVPWGEKCRALACWCRSKTCIAVTLRGHKLPANYTQPGTLPKIKYEYRTAPEALAKYIPTSTERLKGLVVVAGETGSGKSNLADGLLRELLPDDGGHIVALGNPVDWRPYHKDTSQLPLPDDWAVNPNHTYKHFGVHYTPRTLGVDTTLEEALVDALRQKPAAVYLDEVRKETDWPLILRFAESGHLIVTTTHAGSIRDALAWIFRSMHVTNRSQAPGVARNILAVLHAKLTPIIGTYKQQEPEIWLGQRGAHLLGAYGPGALIPVHDDGAAYIARDFIARLIYPMRVYHPPV
jgi:hypothetical protein